jgi:hypothetical protein
MTVVLEVLSRAQRLLAGDAVHGPGWTGPEHVMGYCRRRWGTSAAGLPITEVCDWSDEAVVQFSVEGALRAAAHNDAALLWGAWELLRSIVAPSVVASETFVRTLPPLTQESWPQWRLWVTLCNVATKQLDLEDWLRAPNRTLMEVLRAFDAAVLKAKGRDQ